MIPGSFEYHRPATVDEAVALLSTHGDEGRPLAGGHSLIPMMKLRLATPAHLVDLGAIDALRAIGERDGALAIGAMVTQHDVIGSALLAEKCPILRETALLIADPQVRYCGTLGGNVANGDPGNDMPAVMMALGASYLLQGPNGSRSVAAADYYEGAFFTVLEEGELLTAVSIPTPKAGHGFAYEKLKRKLGDYATAAAAVILEMDGGSCSKASIALTNVGQTPIHAGEAAAALGGTSVDEAAIAQASEKAAEAAEPVADMRGPEDYRRHVTAVMVARAIARARDRAA